MKKTLAPIVAAVSAGLLLPACNDGGSMSPGGISGAHITGVVRVQGHPVQGAQIHGPNRIEAWTDASGHYCLSAPTFTRLSLTVQYRIDAQVRAGDWSGGAIVETGDFDSCEHAQVQDFDLEFNPL